MHRRRIDYAFRCFCAIYGHTPIPKADSGSADIWIGYSNRSKAQKGVVVTPLPNLYLPRPANVPAPTPELIRLNGSALELIHGSLHGNADWLAEVFEWLSCADEYSVTERDAVGRVPFRNTLIGRKSLDPLVPRAAVAMQHLEQSLMQAVGQSDRPQSQANGKARCIVNTHDVDFLSTSRSGTSFRLAKNCLISFVNRSPALAFTQAIYALRTAFGGTAPFVSPQSLADYEIRRGVTASYYFLVTHSHRRDGNYAMTDPEVLRLMEYLQNAGMEVGVHNSYTCMDEPDGMAKEYRILSELGFRTHGGRQHWLRLSIGRLIEAIERAHARYDASLGWTDQPGFRAGACFAFPPYDFRNERPADFLELPLVITDSALAAAGNLADATQVVGQILKNSCSFHGGFSILWHPAAFGGAQLPAWVGNAFWSTMEISTQQGDAWRSAENFLDQAHEQYVTAGLLSGDGADAHLQPEW